jgi:hypothetical protein
MLTTPDGEKQEAKARKEEQKAKRADENQSKIDNKRHVISKGKIRIKCEDEGAMGSQTTDLGALPYVCPIPTETSRFSPLSPGSLEIATKPLEEPQERKLFAEESDIPDTPPSNEVNFTEPERLKKLSLEEHSRSAEDETNKAEAVSEVDLMLLDPALHKPDPVELHVLDINNGELHPPADNLDAEIITPSVLNAPLTRDIPGSETVVPNETKRAVLISATVKAPMALKADSPHPPRANDSASELPESLGSDVPYESRDAPFILTRSTSVDLNTTPKSPKGESRVSSWLKTKFGRRTTKSTEQPTSISSRDPEDPASLDVLSHENAESDDSFKQGISIHNEKEPTSVATKIAERDLHATTVSMPEEIEPMTSPQPIKTTSSDKNPRGIAPTPKQRTSGSHEDFEETLDQFDFENIPPSTAPIDDGHDGNGEKQVRDSKFQENL